eukprot:TRINITY_DN10634_c0_g1_i1.p1 TRINITY_DN10634_c0_g1~~TRINITY_DN10634_c0_g1_i1.p1  ORF type:complete len:304 (-),score=73.96 TRINITY_DN10634_c0_g1_i1:80-991(-)
MIPIPSVNRNLIGFALVFFFLLALEKNWRNINKEDLVFVEDDQDESKESCEQIPDTPSGLYAVCISGGIDDFDLRRPSLMEHVIDANGEKDGKKNVHIFGFFKTGVKEANEAVLKWKEENEFVKKIVIERTNSSKPLNKLVPKKWRNSMQMFRKIYNCFQMILEYERENNIRYDMYMRTRMDIDYESAINFTRYHLNTVYIPIDYNFVVSPGKCGNPVRWFNQQLGLNDQIAFGPKEKMLQYANFYPNALMSYLETGKDPEYLEEQIEVSVYRYFLENSMTFATPNDIYYSLMVGYYQKNPKQ